MEGIATHLRAAAAVLLDCPEHVQIDGENVLVNLHKRADEMNAAAGEIERLLAKAEQKTRWIPVSERLPEEGVDVLAYSPSVGRQVARTIAVDGGVAWYWGTSGILGVDATHWASLLAEPIAIDGEMRALHEVAKEIARTKNPERTVGEYLFGRNRNDERRPGA